MIKAIIFDLDGVLIDATEWHYEALNKALKLFGYEISREEHEKIYNGLPTTEKLKILSQTKNLPEDLYEIVKKMKRIYTDETVDRMCRPSYDKQLMLAELRKRGYRLACCSNAQKYSVINMLHRANIDQMFELIIGNDEGYKPKPSPDVYLAAFEKLGIKPQEALIIEDAPNGIQAAKDSGARVVEVKGFEDVNLSLFTGENIAKYESGLNKYRLDSFTKGWFIGNFDPAIYKTSDFEVAVKEYKKGDLDQKHYHKIANEYTAIINGVFRMNEEILSGGDIVFIKQNEETEFECIEDGSTVVIKVPSVKDDKYLCGENKNG